MTDVLDISYPIKTGLITDWDKMESIWKHCYDNELKVDSKDHNVFLTEVPFNPKPN